MSMNNNAVRIGSRHNALKEFYLNSCLMVPSSRPSGDVLKLDTFIGMRYDVKLNGIKKLSKPLPMHLLTYVRSCSLAQVFPYSKIQHPIQQSRCCNCFGIGRSSMSGCAQCVFFPLSQIRLQNRQKEIQGMARSCKATTVTMKTTIVLLHCCEMASPWIVCGCVQEH